MQRMGAVSRCLLSEMRLNHADARGRGVTIPEILVVMSLLVLLSLLLFFLFRSFLTVSHREERLQILESHRERLLAALKSDLRSVTGLETRMGEFTLQATRPDPTGIPRPVAITYLTDSRRICRETPEGRKMFDFAEALPPGFQVFLTANVIATSSVTVTCGFVGSGSPPLPDRVETVPLLNRLSP